MGVAFHELFAVDGLNNFAVADRIYFGIVPVVYVAGGGAGLAVTKAVTWTEPVPGAYAILFDLPEDAVAFPSLQTSLGFTLNVSPRLAASTLAGGTAYCLIVG